MAHRFLVIKTGKTYDNIRDAHGCFDDWMAEGLGVPREQVDVVSVFEGDALPAQLHGYAGVVITGSPAMVTERLPWSEMLAQRLSEEISQRPGLPVIGICYGHQLLAHALGGDVAYNPRGREIGTVKISLTDAHRDDPLFAGLGDDATNAAGIPPPCPAHAVSPTEENSSSESSLTPTFFDAHVTHLQSVIRLPPNSVHLAASELEPHHAFRVGEHVWGVQFHPEFNEDIMRAYIGLLGERMAGEGMDPQQVYASVRPAPRSNALLRRFAALAMQRADASPLRTRS